MIAGLLHPGIAHSNVRIREIRLAVHGAKMPIHTVRYVVAQHTATQYACIRTPPLAAF